MELTVTTAITPIDGRYRKKVQALDAWFSEFGFMKLRLRVEIEYLIALLKEIKKDQNITDNDREEWRNIWKNFSLDDAAWVKNKEEEIKHDFKALEYFLREKLTKMGFENILSFIHFGLTTYDATTSAYGLTLKEANNEVIIPHLEDLIKTLTKITSDNANQAMLARTHGQPAVPTTLGKEMANFLIRIKKLLNEIKDYQFESKITGAVGSYNALNLTYPEIDWINFSEKLIKSLGLVPNVLTTQILPYDNWVLYFSKLKLLNNVLIGFCQDVWRYISDEYLIQIPKDGEVGSSTMPQKINPIDFENAEGNLGIANSLLEFYERKLPISRLQRDLTDSTVKRTFGVTFAHSILAYANIIAGLNKLTPNKEKLNKDLDEHFEVIAEGIQTVLRNEGISNAYEKLKELTRGKKITQEILQDFINSLDLTKDVKEKLLKLTPQNYVGLAEKLTKLAL